jgi:hypothetical protein
MNPDQVMKATRDPVLYEKVGFLLPMRDAALRLHAQLAAKKCKGCQRSIFVKTALHISGAFVALVDMESKKSPNQLAELHKTLETILGSHVDQFRVAVVRGIQKWEITF